MNLNFTYLPAFAAFIRAHYLETFTRLQLQYSREVDLPLLKLFASMPEQALVELSMASSEENLTYLEQNRTEEQIRISMQRWISDQLPLIGKYEIKAEDITLASYIRTKAFFQLIPFFTADPALQLRIRDELQEYNLATDTAGTNTYIDLLKDKINETEAALTRREEQLLEAEDLAALGSFEWNITDEVITVTPQVNKILGIPDYRELSQLMAVVHPADRKKVQEVIEHAMTGAERLDVEYRVLANGRERIVWARGNLVQLHDKSVFRGTIMDVTDRNRLIRQLQRSEVLHKQTQAMAHIGSWTWDVHTDEMVWTDELYRIYGLEPGAPHQLHGIDVRHFNHPDDAELVREQIRKSLETGEPAEFNYRIVLSDQSTKHVNAKCEVVRDEEGKAIQMFGTLQDITRQQRIEQELMNKSHELEQTNQELEKFASVASHDLQEPLRKVIMFSNLLEKELGSGLSPSARMYINKVTDSTARMQHLISDILRFSGLKSGEVQFTPVSLKSIIGQVLSDMEVLLSSTGAEVRVDELPVIEGNESQLGQLFQNLISNSIKFRQEGRRPVVRIYAQAPGEVSWPAGPEWGDNRQELPGNAANLNKDYCCITVADNGIGFDEVYLDRIFQIFQRLNSRATYEGTGIGLAVCRRVVENHKGFITARSKPGEGSAFMVLLPLTQPPAAARPPITTVN